LEATKLLHLKKIGIELHKNNEDRK